MIDCPPTSVPGRRSAALVACLAFTLMALAGCTGSGSKAGPDAPVTVLRLATPEARGAPYTDDVERFADLVGRRTEGAVRVEPHFQAIPWTAESESTLTRMVQQRKLDLALIPTRVFDTLGIGGFEALQAPMLIDSPELAGAVASSAVADTMLDGLDRHGLVGLALVFEGLRRPMALNGAVRRASDFSGLLVRVPASGVSDRVFAALGAVPDNGTDHTIGTNGEPYPLVETELALADTDFPRGSTVTVNLVLFPKYGALLANPESFARLTDDQRKAVRQAAADTVAAAAQTTADEEDLATTYCEAAGDIVVAPEAEVEAMREMLLPVLEGLREDPGTAEAIDAIRELKGSVLAPAFTIPSACSPPSGDSARFPSEPGAPTPGR